MKSIIPLATFKKLLSKLPLAAAWVKRAMFATFVCAEAADDVSQRPKSVLSWLKQKNRRQTTVFVECSMG